ncbi:unnamed protein product [Heligmosomoides polygyrus]|uniref:Peptidase_M1 domain-containing protein n=1 Tax=Heligmosomoides polygyrus TaxID=6339 RepID=A0A183FZK8_HELPZ|nr:unnamed protein product [Heligmosomoides polygyrus]
MKPLFTDIYGVTVMKVAAMENWGELQYACLLKFFALQWFGNLVTMKWWDDLWLNEGFASMIGLKANDIVENSPLSRVPMRNDQMPNSVPVSRRDEAFDPETAFTSNTYKKATLIMLMVERIVGEVTFRDGLRLFLNQFMYRNVDHTDLLAALTRVYDGATNGGRLVGYNFTLAEVIETWIYQKGFPILHVSKLNDGKVQVTQEIYRVSSLHCDIYSGVQKFVYACIFTPDFWMIRIVLSESGIRN